MACNQITSAVYVIFSKSNAYFYPWLRRAFVKKTRVLCKTADVSFRHI